MKVYHGTTKENYLAILNGDLAPKSISAWSCSVDDNCIYFYSFDAVKANECNSDDDEEYVEAICISKCFEQAQIQAAYIGEHTELVVFSAEIPDNLLESDYSCENMESTAVFCLCDQFKPEYIKDVWKYSFNKWSSPAVISGIIGNPYFNHYDCDAMLLKCAETAVFDETLLDFDYIKTDKNLN